MKIILLVVFYLNAAQSGFAQRLRSGPTDLAVRVEIVGRDIQQVNPRPNSKKEEVLYAKISLQNKTSKVREVIITNCSWYESWASKGEYGLCGWSNGCDVNSPMPLSIPVGQSLVFYSALCSGGNNIVGQKGKLVDNQLGFIDFTWKDFGDQNKAFVVYWSNRFTGLASKKVHIKSMYMPDAPVVEAYFRKGRTSGGGYYVSGNDK